MNSEERAFNSLSILKKMIGRLEVKEVEHQIIEQSINDLLVVVRENAALRKELEIINGQIPAKTKGQKTNMTNGELKAVARKK